MLVITRSNYDYVSEPQKMISNPLASLLEVLIGRTVPAKSANVVMEKTLVTETHQYWRSIIRAFNRLRSGLHYN